MEWRPLFEKLWINVFIINKDLGLCCSNMFARAQSIYIKYDCSLGSLLKRWSHCVSCGGDLVPPVSRTRSEPIISNKGASALQKLKTESLISEMSDTQRQALNWDNDSNTQLQKHELKRNLQGARFSKARKSQICKPCVSSRHGSKTPLVLPSSTPTVFGRKFHAIDAMDFPLGVPFSENEAIRGSGDVFVITRCDLLVPLQSQLAIFKRYAMKTVFEPMGVSADRVHTVSAKNLWNLNKLSESFVDAPKQNYFVGPPNSGKTALVHKLAGTSQMHTGPTTWPVPFTTQFATEFTALAKFRRKKVVDMPSTQGDSGLGLYNLLSPSILRKVGSGQPVVHRDPKYLVPPIKARSGQTVSIGGLIGLEFPRLHERQLPIHVFPLINGLTHTNFGQAFHSPETITKINSSLDPNHQTMRMHTQEGLVLEPIAEFEPVKNSERQALVIKGLGFLQPFLFGSFPEGYAAIVHAPKGTEVMARPEFLPYK